MLFYHKKFSAVTSFLSPLRLCMVGLLLMLTMNTFASERLTVILDWLPNPNHAPLMIAANQHFFQRHGLDVKIIVPANPTDPPKWVALDKADIAIDYQPHVVIEIAHGLPVQQIGTLVDHPLTSLAVLANSSIVNLADLKGRSIGYSSASIDLLMLNQMLHHAGLIPTQVKTISLHYNLMQALLTRRIDAVIGLMRNIELVELALLGQPVRAFYPENYGIPTYSELVFIGKPKHNEESYRRFFAALNEARRYLLNHPRESFEQVVTDYPELNNEKNRVIWLKTVPEFAPDVGYVNKQQYQRVKHFFTKVQTKT